LISKIQIDTGTIREDYTLNSNISNLILIYNHLESLSSLFGRSSPFKFGFWPEMMPVLAYAFFLGCVLATSSSSRSSYSSGPSRLLRESRVPSLTPPRLPIPSTEKESMRSISRSGREFLRSSADIMTYVTGRKEPKLGLKPKIVGGQDANDSQVSFRSFRLFVSVSSPPFF
jgi:hypothetical protein